MQLLGVHHLTAISAEIRQNKRFYTDVMGMRLVKKTVNQDDVSAYHLFYADGEGTPGTDLTFFDWPMPREQRGTRSIVQTGLRVNGHSALEYWQERLASFGIVTGAIGSVDGRQTFTFDDPEGQRLALIDDGGSGDSRPWESSPVPVAMQIRGLGPITISVPALEPTDTTLQNVMNMALVRSYTRADGDTAHVYAMDAGGPQAELHVAVQSNMPVARQGAGGVHHVAFRTPDDEYDAWANRLNDLGVPNSGKVDRYWFRSLYFREPNGILFEIASDGPGFGVDESIESLGQSLVLAPFLEAHRSKIEAGLKPID